MVPRRSCWPAMLAICRASGSSVLHISDEVAVLLLMLLLTLFSCSSALLYLDMHHCPYILCKKLALMNDLNDPCPGSSWRQAPTPGARTTTSIALRSITQLPR